MASWALNTSELGERVYWRPLGLTESLFYYDSQFNGTADTIQHAEVEVLHSYRHLGLFSPENVSRTWLHMKRQFPLLAARVEKGGEGRSGFGGGVDHFVLEEKRLTEVGDNSAEIEFAECSSTEDALALLQSLLNGPRQLSDDLTARLYILRQGDSNSSKFHVAIHAAHYITDVLGNIAFMKRFLETLASSTSEMTSWNLQDQLRLSMSLENLTPACKLPISRQRWRFAIASIVKQIQKSKLNGGHTLPRKITTATAKTPAKSAALRTSLPLPLSQNILNTCRVRGLTIGSVQPILGQVALTRLLLRRYLRGQISQEEWDFRRKEPTYPVGPVNVRPRLDRQWFEQGGADNFSLAIGFAFMKLPFVPLGNAADLKRGDELPGYEQLLSPARFFLRAGSVKTQLRELVSHPLSFELVAAGSRPLLEMRKATSAEWKAHRSSGNAKVHEETGAGQVSIFEPLTQFVPAFGGSTFGDLDRLLPHQYPIHGSEPKLKLLSTNTFLHCRPTELYLGTVSFRQQLQMLVLYDENVYDKDVVREWLDEIKLAAEFYLGSEYNTTKKRETAGAKL